MTDTATRAEQTIERAAAQPVIDAVQNFAPSEKTTSWSDVASQIWSSNLKEYTSSLGSTLRTSLGFGNQDAQTALESNGTLPHTRVKDANAKMQSPRFVVEWGARPLPGNAGERQSESEQGTRPRLRVEPSAMPFDPARDRRFAPVIPAADRMAPGQVFPGSDRSAPAQVAPGADRRVREPISPPHDRRGQESGIERERPTIPIGRTIEGVRVYEHKLDNNTGRHKVDASVVVPEGYDPQKPTRLLIYNHGFRTDAHAALVSSELKEQMKSADPQTILVVPEWQAQPGSNSSARGRSDQQNFYRNMINEIMQKTPELRGKTVEDIASIGIIAHSAGYNPAMAQLYKNGLKDKITSVTVLDSMYNASAYDRWITDSLRDLAAGNKQFQLIYTGHLAGQSNGLQQRVEQQLRRAGLGTDSVHKDHGRGSGIVSSETMAQHGFVFKRSEYTARGDGAHGAMTRVYLRQLLDSEKRRRG